MRGKHCKTTEKHFTSEFLLNDVSSSCSFSAEDRELQSHNRVLKVWNKLNVLPQANSAGAEGHDTKALLFCPGNRGYSRVMGLNVKKKCSTQDSMFVF